MITLNENRSIAVEPLKLLEWDNNSTTVDITLPEMAGTIDVASANVYLLTENAYGQNMIPLEKDGLTATWTISKEQTAKGHLWLQFKIQAGDKAWMSQVRKINVEDSLDAEGKIVKLYPEILTEHEDRIYNLETDYVWALPAAERAEDAANISETAKGIAIEKANIATDKADEAARSESAAAASEQAAKTSENNAKESEEEAEQAKTEAVRQAGIATDKAEEAVWSAETATEKADQARVSAETAVEKAAEVLGVDERTQAIYNSIYHLQKAPPLDLLGTAIVLITPTIDML